MLNAIERALETALAHANKIGEIAIRPLDAGGFALCHCDDQSKSNLAVFPSPEDAIELSKFDDAGNYRPLKTAPNLRHGWKLEVVDLASLSRALDYFYPGRLAAFAAKRANELPTTSLRETLNRQTGMYRVAANISDAQIDEVVGNFCRSDGGCLRTILWGRDESGALPSRKLPEEKYDPGSTTPAAVPLLCQEACNLLVNECRKVVKLEGAAPSAPK